MEMHDFIANDICVVIMQALTFARQGKWKEAAERLRMALYILEGEEK